MKVLALDSLPLELQTAIRDGQVRTLCPSCRGGQSGEVSLSIRELDDSIIKLSCWRASCGFYAVSFIDPAARLQSSKLKEGRVYPDATFRIKGDLASMLAADYGLSPAVYDKHGWRQDERGTLVMPVLSRAGLTRGHLTRTFEEPKRCMAYKETSRPWLDWWNGNLGTPVVVVEDQLSACRLAALGYRAVSLMGTSISCDDAREIAGAVRYRDNVVWLALDRDAYLKSLRLVKRHRHIVDMKPVCLDADIKNMNSDGDIAALFGDDYVRRDYADSSSGQGQASL